MGHLLNEPVRAEHDPAGRFRCYPEMPTAYEWRGSRYAVEEVLKTYGTPPDGRVYRVRVVGAEGVAVAELGRDRDRWRLRHVFSA